MGIKRKDEPCIVLESKDPLKISMEFRCACTRDKNVQAVNILKN